MRISKISLQSKALTKSKVRLIARLKGDGSVFVSGRRGTNYYIKFFSINEEELQRFKKDIKEVYGLDVKEDEKVSGKNPTKIVKNCFIRSKLVFEDLIKYGPFGSFDWRVPEEIKNNTLDVQREFLKTFSEDEGTIVINKPEVKIYSVNKRGLEELQAMLRNFDIESKIQKGYGFKRNIFGIVIRGQNILKFKEKIGFLSETKNSKLEKLVSNLNSSKV